MRLLRILVVGGGLVAAASTHAQAQWRYCLAAADEAHKIYLSDPFLASAPLARLEAGFKQVLTDSGVVSGDAQCPLGASERQIRAMRQDAIQFNREFFHRSAVELHWTPGSPSAGAATGNAP